MPPDVARLRNELATLFEATLDALQCKHPDWDYAELHERARSDFLSTVDDAAREVTSR